MNIEKKIKRNIPLSSLTTFKIGGKAKFFIEISTKDDLLKAIDWAKKRSLDFFILGGGSNLLINDILINKLVIKLNNKIFEINGQIIRCGAGLKLGYVCQKAIKEKLTGIEWAVGIPGTIGGAVRGNAAAFDKSISENILKIEVYDIKKNKFFQLKNKQCGFSYKQSIIKNKKNLIIWDVLLKLNFDKKNIQKELIKKYLETRKTHPNLPSAGCIFKNLTADYVKKNNPSLYLEAKNNKIIRKGRISAGWIINQTSLPGKTIGGAQVSPNHSNFIVNKKNARAEEVLIMISLIKQKIRSDHKLQLQEEIELLGF